MGDKLQILERFQDFISRDTHDYRLQLIMGQDKALLITLSHFFSKSLQSRAAVRRYQ